MIISCDVITKGEEMKQNAEDYDGCSGQNNGEQAKREYLVNLG